MAGTTPWFSPESSALAAPSGGLDADGDGEADVDDSEADASDDMVAQPAFPDGEVDADSIYHETTVYGADSFCPDSSGALRIMVTGAKSLFDSVRLTGAKVSIGLRLRGTEDELTSLLETTTSALGTVDGSFHVPAVPDGNYDLVVVTSSAYGDETLTLPIKIDSSFRVLLISDKPMYQPNQVIHMRATCLNQGNLKPAAGRELIFEVDDSKGNKVFKRRATTNDYGIAAVDFQLADEINMGSYTLRTILGNHETEKGVTIERYTLPKFGVVVNANKQFFLPGDTIEGTIDAQFTFGKPVDNADVLIVASTFDVEFTEFAQLTTRTGDDGTVEFEIPLPDYFVGQPLERGDAIIKLEITVIDATGEKQKKTVTYPVANNAVRVTALPESGALVPDVENILYVVTTYPDGRPASTTCTVTIPMATNFEENPNGDPFTPVEHTVTTDAYGLGEVRFTPGRDDFQPGEWKEYRTKVIGVDTQNWSWNGNYRQTWGIPVTIAARDEMGQEGTYTHTFNTDPMSDNILVRTNKAIYTAGERMSIDVLTSFTGGVLYLDITKNDQTLLTKALELDGSTGHYELDLSDDFFGVLELHVYKRLTDGTVIRDTKVLYTHPRTDLEVEFTAFREHVDPDTGEITRVPVEEGTEDCFRPGEDAILQFCVTDRDGNPTQAALGVTIVDEAVYLLQDMRPGIEKIYFTIENELMQPKYHMKELPSVPQLVSISAEDLEAELQTAGQILLSRVEPIADYTIAIDPAATRLQQFNQNLQTMNWLWYDYVVPRANEFIEMNENGEPKYRADAREKVIERAREWGYGDLAETLFALNLGRPITLEDLGDYSPMYRPEYLEATYNIERILRVLRAAQTAQAQGITLLRANADGSYRFVDDALTLLGFGESDETWPPRLVDGEPLTLEDVIEACPDFEPTALFEGLEDNRALHVLQALQATHLNHGNVFERERRSAPWHYRADLEQFCADASQPIAGYLTTPLGQRETLDQLIARHEALSQDVVAEYLAVNTIATCLSYLDAMSYWYTVVTPDDDTAPYVELPENMWQVMRSSWGLPRRFNVDAWGSILVLERTEDLRDSGTNAARYHLVSPGPDKIYGNDDDLRDVTVLPESAVALTASGNPYDEVVNRVDNFYQLIRWYDPGYLFEDDPDVTGAMLLRMQSERLEQQRGWGRGMLRRDSRARGGRFGGGGMPVPGTAAPSDRSGGWDLDEENSDEGAAMDPTSSTGEPGSAQRKASIRVREYFPETLLWAPALVTDENGRYELRHTMADSITTWRVTATANNQQGMLGGGTAGIRVFQDFFVDIDLPVALTQNDEVSVPVTVFNYLDTDQTVVIELENDDWFVMLEESNQKSLPLAAFERTVVYFRIKVKELGCRTFTTWAFGSKQDDAVRRQIIIEPDGNRFEAVYNGQLTQQVQHVIDIPEESVPGASKILCKVYPGIFAQMIEGIAGMVGMPHG